MELRWTNACIFSSFSLIYIKYFVTKAIYSFLYLASNILYQPPIRSPTRAYFSAQGKGKQCSKVTLSDPTSKDYGEQIPNGMSQQTIKQYHSAIDTELTITVRNLVAKIR